MSYRLGVFHSCVYIAVIFALFYNSVYCVVEILGMFEDKTRDEIFNPFDYPYNFEIIGDKKGNFVKVMKIRTNGLIEYLKHTFLLFYYRTFLHLKSKK